MAAIARVSIECRKTKTKVITLANQKGRRQSSKPIISKLEVTKRSLHKAPENVHVRATIVFGFTPDCLTKWRENFQPIIEWSNAKPTNSPITLDTQLKTTDRWLCWLSTGLPCGRSWVRLRPDQHSGSLNTWGKSAAFVITSANG